MLVVEANGNPRAVGQLSTRFDKIIWNWASVDGQKRLFCKDSGMV